MGSILKRTALAISLLSELRNDVQWPGVLRMVIVPDSSVVPRRGLGEEHHETAVELQLGDWAIKQVMCLSNREARRHRPERIKQNILAETTQ